MASTSEQALTQRIKALRRRHFGPRGRDLFAQRLGLPVDEYTRYERGSVPPGDVMVRMCEVTGEDLQWLLTGVPARGTVVIAGTRGRHQDLLAHLARLLDGRPELAAPVEAFVDLLARGAAPCAQTAPALPRPPAERLVPIFEPGDLPLALPECPTAAPGPFELAAFSDVTGPLTREAVELCEPGMRYASDAAWPAEVLTRQGADGRTQRCVRSRQIAHCFPGLFGVQLADDAMKPMFRAGDAVLVAVGAEAQIGRPVLCRVLEEPTVRCRIWLGEDEGLVHLGRLADGECERVAPDKVLWSLEVLFRLARAA